LNATLFGSDRSMPRSSRPSGGRRRGSLRWLRWRLPAGCAAPVLRGHLALGSGGLRWRLRQLVL